MYPLGYRLTIIFLLLSSVLTGQNIKSTIPSNGMTLQTQSQMDNLCQGLKENGINTITGNVYLNAKNISSVNLRDSSLSIQGFLTIDSLDRNELDFLKKFKHISALEFTSTVDIKHLDLTPVNNASALVIKLCNSLNSVGLPEKIDNEGFINFAYNDSLSLVSGCNEVSEMYYLEFFSNPNLKRVEGFNNLERLKVLSLKYVLELNNIEWLSQLTSIEKSFFLIGNRRITTLDQLSKLEYVGNRLYIEYCDQLRDISTLDDITMEEYEVNISDNFELNSIPLNLICKALEYNQYCEGMDKSIICCNSEEANKQVETCGSK